MALVHTFESTRDTAHTATPTTGARNAVIVTAAPWVIATVCVLVAVHAVRTANGFALSEASGIPVVAALAIIISVGRWPAKLGENAVRPVSSQQAVLALSGFFLIATSSVMTPAWTDLLFGPMITACLICIYLACWGFRSLFLLRRVVLLSLLIWAPLARGVHIIVRRSIDQSSDLIYRRLSSLPMLHIEQHPWRLFSAMTHRGVIVSIGTVLLGVVMTRRRSSLHSLTTIIVAMFLASVGHHLAILIAPIETYAQSPWIKLLTGPLFEIAIAASAATLAAYIGRRATEHSDVVATTAALDRDPVIFAVQGREAPSTLLTACCALLPALYLVAAFAV